MSRAFLHTGGDTGHLFSEYRQADTHRYGKTRITLVWTGKQVGRSRRGDLGRGYPGQG